MARTKPDPADLPTVDDLDGGAAAELRELEERADRLREAADQAEAEFRRLESEYLQGRDSPTEDSLEAAAEAILDGEDPDVVEDWQGKAEEAREALKRHQALELAHDRATDRIEELRTGPVAEQLAEAWADDLDANASAIGSLLKQLVERLEIQREMRAKMARQVGSGAAVPGFPTPTGARRGQGSPNLSQLGRICETHLDDYEAPA